MQLHIRPHYTPAPPSPLCLMWVLHSKAHFFPPPHYANSCLMVIIIITANTSVLNKCEALFYPLDRLVHLILIQARCNRHYYWPPLTEEGTEVPVSNLPKVTADKEEVKVRRSGCSTGAWTCCIPAASQLGQHTRLPAW